MEERIGNGIPKNHSGAMFKKCLAQCFKHSGAMFITFIAPCSKHFWRHIQDFYRTMFQIFLALVQDFYCTMFQKFPVPCSRLSWYNVPNIPDPLFQTPPVNRPLQAGGFPAKEARVAAVIIACKIRSRIFALNVRAACPGLDL